MNSGARNILTGLVATACLLVSTDRARSDELRSKVERQLVEIKRDLFDKRGIGSVAVGEFTGPANLTASGGPAISNALIDAFEKIGLKIDKKAAIEVGGRYRPGSVKGLNSLRIHLNFEEQASGNSLLESDLDIVDAATIMRIAGGTGDISGRTRKEQSDKVERVLKNPSAQVRSGDKKTAATTRITADEDSVYAIEVLVRPAGGDFRPIAAAVKEGQAFVPLARDDVYAVRLYNDSALDAAVNLAIDGLSMFAFSDRAEDRDSRLIVPRHSNVTIVGWFRHDGPSGSNEFLVSKRSEAAVAKLMPESSAQIGMITATFSVAWPKDEPAPADEEPFVPTKDDLATAIGKPINQPFQRVDYLFGKPKTAITVRYNRAVEPGDLPR